jgi:hypothetical protein
LNSVQFKYSSRVADMHHESFAEEFHRPFLNSSFSL